MRPIPPGCAPDFVTTAIKKINGGKPMSPGFSETLIKKGPEPDGSLLYTFKCTHETTGDSFLRHCIFSPPKDSDKRKMLPAINEYTLSGIVAEKYEKNTPTK